MSELIKRNEWLRLTPQEKIERLLGRSLDDTYELLNIPLEEARLEPAVLNAQVHAIRVILMTAVKLGIEREERSREDWRAYLKEVKREGRALGIGPVKARSAKMDSSQARK